MLLATDLGTVSLRAFREFGGDGPVLVALATIAGIFSFGIAWLAIHARLQRRRLDVLEQALRQPSVPPETLRELSAALQPHRPRRFVFALGWFGMFAGVAWLCTKPYPPERTIAVATCVASFALMALPLALRELETRKA